MNGVPNAFGIEPRAVDDAVAARGIEHRPALAAQVAAIESQARREMAIAAASGRWAVGRPDPDVYVPGDTVAVRSLAVTAEVLRLQHKLHLLAARPRNTAEREAQLDTAASALLAVGEMRALFEAVPHWLDATTAAGVLDSRPPAPEVLAELRLPYPRLLISFERRFELPAALMDWPRAWDHAADRRGHDGARRSAIGDLRALGGAIEGAVLTEANGGGLGDEVIWLVSANPDPALPAPLSLDRYRGFVWGRLRSARLAHVVHNLAAAVCWAEWRTPQWPLPLPDDVGSKAWRKAVRRGEFRRREPAGAAAGVHVVDLRRSPVVARARAEGDGNLAARQSPTTHLRRAHWRLQPVGRERADRRLVRVAATVVNPGVGTPVAAVYRIPAPDDAAANNGIEGRGPAVVDLTDDAVIDLRTLPLPGPKSPLRQTGAAPEVSL